MKRVILCAYACSPLKGSEEGSGWSWTINIARQGFEVICLTNSQDEVDIIHAHKKLGLPNLKFVFIKLPIYLDKWLFNAASKSVYIHYLLWRRQAGKIAEKMHLEKPFDIAHHVTYGSLQQGSFLWKLKGVIFVVGPVGGGQMSPKGLKAYFGDEWKTEKMREYISKISFYLNRDLRQTLKYADHFLLTNNETKDLLKQSKHYDENKTHIISDNAVPPSMENLAFISRTYLKPIRLLWVGRILPRKGLNLILHALSYLPKTVDFKLTIVGGGPLYKNVPTWISQYNLDANRIILTGAIPFDEVVKQYQEADVFVFCSLRDSRPAQINEAMAFGLVPIVLDIHGSALAVNHNTGIKVPATHPIETAKAISVAIASLYNDTSLLSQMSRAAYQQSKLNTWQEKIDWTVQHCYSSV